MNDDQLTQLWEEYRAAILVMQRVKTPEVEAEVRRARRAFLLAMAEEDLRRDTS